MSVYDLRRRPAASRAGSAKQRRGRPRLSVRASCTAFLASVLALALAGLLTPASASAATSSQRQLSALVGVTASPRLAALGDTVVGTVASGSEVTAEVALKPRSQAAITSFVSAVSNPRSPLFHHYLAPGQYAGRFGPTETAVSAVERSLRADGLSVLSVSSNRLLVTFRGTASRVEAAFHTGLERVRLASGGIGRATTTAVRLPGSVARYVQAVIGLDALVPLTSGLERDTRAPRHVSAASLSRLTRAARGVTSSPVACSAALADQAEYGALTDTQVATSYGAEGLYHSGDLGAGQTVDIYELEPFSLSDVAGFDQCYFGESHTSNITVTKVDGGPGTGLGSGEAALDVDDVSALAPNAKIHVFEAPNVGPDTDAPFSSLDVWNAIATADDAHQVSTSWGLCETEFQQGQPGVQAAENDIFEQTAAQGQSVFSAAGDDGSDDCAGHDSTPVATDLSVDDPASQPYVVSVGGTTITNATEPPDEIVWNNGDDGGAGGGGVSETWAMPSWQAGVAVTETTADEACSNDSGGTADLYHLAGVPTVLSPGTLCRETPDVSALADPQTGITIDYDGQFFPIGGTSSSTPLWAAMTADMNASTACGGNTLGFVSPLLYEVGGSTTHGTAFDDITAGNNDNLGIGNGTTWSAGPGYDMASGLGTPRLTNTNGMPGLDAQLCGIVAPSDTTRPSVSTLTPSNGPIAGGTPVTIAGSNFGATKGSVFFGTEAVPSADLTWSATSIAVSSTPAYVAPPGTPLPVASGADVTVVTAAGASSSPGTHSVFHYTGNTTGTAPIIDYVSSSSGPTGGGNTVTINGAGFTGATSVTFGGVAGTSLTVVNDDRITVKAPADTTATCANSTAGICQVVVEVFTAGGHSSTTVTPILPPYTGPITYTASGAFLPTPDCGCEVVPQPDEYDYAAAPVITSISPSYASEAGGTAVTINGSGFDILDVYFVDFGPASENTSQVSDYLSIAPTQMVVVAPGAPIAAATTQPVAVDVSVTSGGGASAVTTYHFAGIPTVTHLSTHAGSQPDPGSLTITGKGLIDANLVEFLGQAPFPPIASTSSLITDQSNTSLKVQVPQFFDVATDVLVCSETGCSTPNPAVDTYTFAYPGRPVVNSSSPSKGPAHGGTIVTINGSNDANVTKVLFGSTQATLLGEPIATASGPITVAAPPGKAGGTVNVTIFTVGGSLVGKAQSAVTTKARFTYSTSTPSAPLDVAATAGKNSAHVTWLAPVTNGGDAITGYVITATAKGEKTVTVAVSASTRHTSVLGLKAGISWTLTVRASSKLGLGLAASAAPVKPT